MISKQDAIILIQGVIHYKALAVATCAVAIVVDYVPFGGMTIKDRAKEFFNGG